MLSSCTQPRAPVLTVAQPRRAALGAASAPLRALAPARANGLKARSSGARIRAAAKTEAEPSKAAPGGGLFGAFLRLFGGGLSASASPDLVTRLPLAVDYEGGPLPLNTHGVGKAGKNPPFSGKIIKVTPLGGRDREREVTELVIATGGVRFNEGQSFGVVPPGTKLNSKGAAVPQHNRLYSISSSRYGDDGSGQTCTLTVVRVVYKDESGATVRGVCSNYLCDRKVGDELVMTGPAGTALLLPEQPWAEDTVVCVATGTGIAPFRSFWRRLFVDAVPGKTFGGKYQLYAGFANEDSVLYGKELRAIAAANPGRMRLDIALSLQETNAAGGPNYVQDRIEANAEEFLDLMVSGRGRFYFCGLKRMYSSVTASLERLGAARGIDTPALITKLKHEHRWYVETA